MVRATGADEDGVVTDDDDEDVDGGNDTVVPG
jgi:hypothetical protein